MAYQELKTYLCHKIPKLFSVKDRREGRRGRYWAWNWGYLGRAATALYGRTQDPDLLEVIINAHGELLACRDDRLGLVDDFRGRVMPSWGTTLRDDETWRRDDLPQGMRACEVEGTGLILLPFTDLLLRDTDQRLPGNIRTALLTTIREGIESHRDELIADDASGGGYFMSPWTGVLEPLNHAHLLAAAAAEAWALTGEDTFRDLAGRVYAFFRHNWYREANGTISWSYKPLPDDPKAGGVFMRYGQPGYTSQKGAEFFHKAAITIELPAAMSRAGLLDDDDMELIASSLFTNVFREGNRMNYNIGPRKVWLCSDPIVPKSPAILHHYLGSYDLLSPFHPLLRGRIESLVLGRADLFPDGWFSGTGTILALARRMAAA